MRGRTIARKSVCRQVPALLLGLSAFALGQSQISSGPAESRVLRIWGAGVHGESPFLPVLVLLEASYQQQHPEIRFEHHLYGDDSALGGLYSGAADLALMEREPSYIELDGYQQVLTREKPFIRTVLLGAGRRPGHSSPLVIVVNRKNPLQKLALDQIDAIFNAERSSLPKSRRGPILLWNELGLEGAWHKRALHPYGFHAQSPESQTLVAEAMDGVVRWSCAFVAVGTPAGGQEAAARVAERVAQDRYGVGVTTLDVVTSAVRAVPIVDTEGTPQLPVESSLLNDRYALRRGVTALFRDRPGVVNEEVRRFVDYMASDEAESVIRADGSYLPLRSHAQQAGGKR
ncbi:PstS family phosphate ABC transporter substrate-binding protein [Tunturibacter empetritectus]|uniref:Phosphate transport system substrate-binding protein n=1 Tax=Tunturiibacter lichenicola TaxID=2051959 RepID=A0A7W8N593_9BACT|nr:substrate-binding domain-containing protein [Edaphobacter lichenicola]MBB5343745.1 phosphate transport system substrate-binding protein [Edaphobacter lichenicola]